MPVITSGQITINNIVDTLTCVIHSSGSQAIAGKETTTLICRVFNSEGEVDLLDNTIGHEYNYFYLWQRNGADWRENIAEGKEITLGSGDFLDSNVFSCKIYDRIEYQNYLNSGNTLSEPSFLSYGEISIDTTVKKWMTFDDQTGLWIRKTNGEYTTLTDENGYHIYKIPSNLEENQLYNINNLEWIASFARDSLMVPRIRMGNVIAQRDSDDKGWRWTSYIDGDKI